MMLYMGIMIALHYHVVIVITNNDQTDQIAIVTKVF